MRPASLLMTSAVNSGEEMSLSTVVMLPSLLLLSSSAFILFSNPGWKPQRSMGREGFCLKRVWAIALLFHPLLQSQ